jgi:hypothetical protein
VDGSVAEEVEAVDIGQLCSSCKGVQHLKRLGREAAVNGSAAED